MINEEMLKKAAAETDQAIRDSLPAPEKCEHEFSTSFQRKMRRIFRRTRHPVIYKLLQYAACFVLVVALAGGTWLTIDAEARAAVFAWIRERYESFVEYRFIGEAPQDNTVSAYELTWLPDGFYLIDEQVLDGITLMIYAADSGDQIIFSFVEGSDSTSLFMAADYIEVQSVKIGNINADFYQAGNETSSNGLIWTSEEQEVCFCITACLPKDTIIQLAEGVKKNNSEIFKVTVQNDLLYSCMSYDE